MKTYWQHVSANLPMKLCWVKRKRHVRQVGALGCLVRLQVPDSHPSTLAPPSIHSVMTHKHN